MFAILADPTRRLVLDTLREGECAVGELVSAVGISQPGVSKQLRVLHEAGLVQVRAEGKRRIYRLDAGPLRELDLWLERYRPFWQERLDALERHLDRKHGRGGKA
ncbi:MAG TPA: metalloregulator ArsR/SmtB family transcription factor [Candidatus Thermoplasmatota archaeon]|nr:metalloregulator ArsR/SmtB family transcription factor [Candidatus Thermoplasmatota archaeon]